MQSFHTFKSHTYTRNLLWQNNMTSPAWKITPPRNFQYFTSGRKNANLLIPLAMKIIQSIPPQNTFRQYTCNVVYAILKFSRFPRTKSAGAVENGRWSVTSIDDVGTHGIAIVIIILIIKGNLTVWRRGVCFHR